MRIQPVSQTWETWKWVAAIIAAILLGMLFATVVAGADRVARPVPETLPQEVSEEAVPMPQAEAEPATDLAVEVWNILDLHRARQHEMAITAWQRLDMPAETIVWKWVGLGQAYLAHEQFDEAEEMLGRAIDMQPDNALAFYLRGVLRMQQAFVAREWPETLHGRTTRLVGFTPREIVPNNKSMYELAAAMDFELAIDLAPMLELDALLVPVPATGGVALEPTVGDFVLALGAEKFPAKAHNALSYLFLKQGALELAETHMDDAVKGGLDVVYGYQDLGDEYEARGQHLEATRAYLKATKFAPNKMGTLRDAMENFWKGLLTP